MATQLIHVLPRLRGRVRVEAAQGAFLHQLQTPRRGEAEDAALIFGVAGGHDNGHSLIQHGLVAALGVDVHTGQEAGLGVFGGRRVVVAASGGG